MDDIVWFLDTKLLEPCYEALVEPVFPQLLTSWFLQGSVLRQILCLEITLFIGATFLYVGASSFTYWLFFVHLKDTYHKESDPQPGPGQVWEEISYAMKSLPVMAQFFWPFFLGQVRGYSRLYTSFSDYGWIYFVFGAIWFLVWSDSWIYWIHRHSHESKFFYKNYHKVHHRFKVTTPYASFAMHPIDAFVQGLPYVIFPYFFPMQKWFYLCSFFFLQLWTVLIHDGVHLTPVWFINGAAHHSLHHTQFNYNYGQYLTIWDRFCKTYLNPFSKYDKNLKEWVPLASG